MKGNHYLLNSAAAVGLDCRVGLCPPRKDDLRNNAGEDRGIHPSFRQAFIKWQVLGDRWINQQV